MKMHLRKIIKEYIFSLFYGFSLITPYTKQRPYYFAVGLPIFYIIMLFLLGVISSMADPSYSGDVVLILMAIFIFGFIKMYYFFEQMFIFLDKTRVVKFYKIKVRDIDRDSETFYTKAISMHRKYGKYEEYQKCDRCYKLKYIEDQELIKEYKQYNRKWMLIAFLHVLLAVIYSYFFIE